MPVTLKNEPEGYKRGVEEGYELGYKAGYEAATKETLKRIDELLAKLKEGKK